MSTETKCQVCAEPATFQVYYRFACTSPQCCWDVT